MFQSPKNCLFQRSSPMILVNKKNCSLLIVLENKARNNIEYCCTSKMSLFRLQKCLFSKSKIPGLSKGANPLFWSVPLRKYGDVICPLQKRSFTVTLHEKKCIHHACSDDVALSLSLQKIFLGICTVKKLRN